MIFPVFFKWRLEFFATNDYFSKNVEYSELQSMALERTNVTEG